MPALSATLSALGAASAGLIYDECSGVELPGDAFDRVMSREDGALLPTDEVGEVVAGEVGLPLRLLELGVSRLAAREKIVCEASRGSKGFWPNQN